MGRDDVSGGTFGSIKWPLEKGAQLIILGADGESGWIPTTTHIQIQINTRDYHDEMTAENFEEWFATKLLPNVPPNGLIVMDNVTYHSHRSDPAQSRVGQSKQCMIGFRQRELNFQQMP